MKTISILKGERADAKELGTVEFKRLPVKSEEDVIRHGVEIALRDLQTISTFLESNAVVGNVGELEWRLE